jgi:UDP-N-acetylglucosamine diphosphorylase/glucosamine-1-phosphate N-acetyltransferase
MNIILSDAGLHTRLLPLTYTRPVAELKTGILSNRERWEKYLPGTYSYQTEEYLQKIFKKNTQENNLVINAAVIPDQNLIAAIKNLQSGALKYRNQIIAAWCKPEEINNAFEIEHLQTTEYQKDITIIENVWDLFGFAGELIKADFKIITNGRKSQNLSSTNRVIGDYPIFLEEGVEIEFAILNTKNGPIYLGKHSLVMEGTKIRGPFSLGEYGVIKMDAKIYGPTCLGNHCKVGGELNNVVMFNYSNKAHDGFLGNAVIGEWCNLGADTNNSNLKNNYAEVKLWSYEKEKFVNTGLQFCGLIMGDHTKCGINTMFNTGTVVGVSANIFGPGFPRNYIPSFSWGGALGFTSFKLEKAIEVAEKMMERRKIKFSEQDREVFGYIYDKVNHNA